MSAPNDSNASWASLSARLESAPGSEKADPLDGRGVSINLAGLNRREEIFKANPPDTSFIEPAAALSTSGWAQDLRLLWHPPLLGAPPLS
jgi:hypothetical protein